MSFDYRIDNPVSRERRRAEQWSVEQGRFADPPPCLVVPADGLSFALPGGGLRVVTPVRYTFCNQESQEYRFS